MYLTKLILLTKLSNYFKAQHFFLIHCECISRVLRHFTHISGKDDISKMISWRRLSYFGFEDKGKDTYLLMGSYEDIFRGQPHSRSKRSWVQPSDDRDQHNLPCPIWPVNLLDLCTLYSYPVPSLAHRTFKEWDELAWQDGVAPT